MTTSLGVLSMSLLLLGLAVRESISTPLTVVGLMATERSPDGGSERKSGGG